MPADNRFGANFRQLEALNSSEGGALPMMTEPVAIHPRSSSAHRVGVVAAWVLGVAAVAGLYGGTIRFALWEKSISPAPPPAGHQQYPPLANSTDVLPNAFVACDVFLPHTGHGVETASMTSDHVKLFHVLDNGKRVEVPGHVNTSGAGDSIVFQPTDLLQCDSTYTFEEHGARDTSDSPEAEFLPFRLTFHTVKSAALSRYPVAFDKVMLAKHRRPWHRLHRHHDRPRPPRLRRQLHRADLSVRHRPGRHAH